MLTVSLSAVTLFRQCEQAYYHSYVEGLERIDRPIARSRGVILHLYLSSYYQALQRNVKASQAHADAKALVSTKYQRVLLDEAKAAWQKGDEQQAESLAKLLPACLRIIDRYYVLHGEADSRSYEVLAVERNLRVKLSPGITSVSVIDLITKDKTTGNTVLWEHKSPASVPTGDVRLRDLQTVLYRVVAERELGLRINRVLWNYLRTKEPAEPDLLKSGQLTRKASLDTTWEVYRQAIKKHGLNEADYADVQAALVGQEAENYFPRFEVPYLANPNVLLRDYITSAASIAAHRKGWENRKVQPVRNFSFGCTGCDFMPLCKAALTGGDLDDVIRLKFRRKFSKEVKSDNSSQAIAEANDWDSALDAVVP